LSAGRPADCNKSIANEMSSVVLYFIKVHMPLTYNDTAKWSSDGHR
jgi:hypothetical protein